MVQLVESGINGSIAPTVSPSLPAATNGKHTTPQCPHPPAPLSACPPPSISNGHTPITPNQHSSLTPGLGAAHTPTLPSTHAPKFHHPSPHRHVLMLLDVQKNMVSDPKTRVHSAEQVRSNISTILEAARAANPPPLIVHIRNVGDPGEPDAPEMEGFELYFDPLPGEHVINKRKNNAFTSIELDELVPKDAEIVVAGMQSDFCVRATCSAALGRGNVVILVRGAHATYDRLEVLHGGGYTKAWEIESEIEAELEEADVILLDMNHVPDLFSDR